MSAAEVAVDAQATANALIELGVLVVEPHGRRWLMIGDRRGFTRSATDRCWWYGDRFNPRTTELTQVTSTYVIAALDAWELTVVEVDSDPTEPHGITWGHGLVAS